MLLASCKTAPKKPLPVGVKDGQWHAKALLQDKRQKKSFSLTLDFRALTPDKLRMEVTNSIGVYLATLVLRGEDIHYMLVREKRFMTGPAEPGVMKELVQMPLEPQDLIKVLFAQPLGSAWKCQSPQNKGGFCEHNSTGAKIVWMDQTEDKRTIELAAPGLTLLLSLEEIKAKVEISDKTFALAPPSGYEVIQLKGRRQEK